MVRVHVILVFVSSTHANLPKSRRGTKTTIYRHTEAAMKRSPHLQLNLVGRQLLIAPPDGRLFRVSEQYLRIRFPLESISDRHCFISN